MDHEIRKQGNAVVVAFNGDIDFNSSPDVRKVLLKALAGGTDVVVDLGQVRYIDSSGVASLIEAYQGAKSGGVQFGLANVSKPALRVLELARLEKVFAIYESVDDALAAG